MSGGSATDPTGRVEFETSDTELAREYLESCYGMSLKLGGGLNGNALRHVRSGTGMFAVDDLWLPLDLRFDVDPQKVVVISELRAGTVAREIDGRHIRPVAGDVYANSRSNLPFTSATHQVAARSTMLNPELLAQVIGPAPGRLPRPVIFTSAQPVSAESAAHWRHTVAYLTDDLLANPTASGQPLILGRAGRLLAATALSLFPNTAITDPSAQDRRDGSPATLRQAISFIDEHAQEDISVADVAAAASVSVRTVQLAFRRHLDTTPMAYLRWVRLDHAHRQLREADPGVETVTSIATRWGFASLSRFTAYYRRTYGTVPSRTLREK